MIAVVFTYINAEINFQIIRNSLLQCFDLHLCVRWNDLSKPKIWIIYFKQCIRFSAENNFLLSDSIQWFIWYKKTPICVGFNAASCKNINIGASSGKICIEFWMTKFNINTHTHEW